MNYLLVIILSFFSAIIVCCFVDLWCNRHTRHLFCWCDLFCHHHYCSHNPCQVIQPCGFLLLALLLLPCHIVVFVAVSVTTIIVGCPHHHCKHFPHRYNVCVIHPQCQWWSPFDVDSLFICKMGVVLCSWNC